MSINHLLDDEKVLLAVNTNSSPEILKELSEDKDYFIRCSVAANPNTPTEILEELSKDKETSVRCSVALNYKTIHSILKKLAIDKDEDVRFFSQNNPNFKLKIIL